eukprot:Skav222985  [mRNA]  locus=scaffold1827:160037:161425:- [translate_table: standard]
MQAAHFYTVCNIFSFAGILCADLNWAAHRNQAGFVAGWLQSSNLFGRIFAASAWGFVASRYGIKLVLTITLIAMLIGGILFGFCTNLVADLSVRFIFFGLLNGWPVLLGPCAVAVAGREGQTRVIGLIYAAEGSMQLIGPAVGGWTYGIVEEFPALLPSLIGCSLSMLALILLVSVRKAFSQPTVKETDKNDKKVALWRFEVKTFFVCPLLGMMIFNGHHFCLQRVVDATNQVESQSDPSVSKSKPLILQWPLPVILIMRFAGGCASYTMYETVPLWLISDNELGGLGMTEKSVGSFLCRSGLWNIIYFTWVMPWFSKRFGIRCYSMVASVIAAALACCIPFSPTMPVANLLHLIWASALVSTNAVNSAFTNNAVSPADRFVATGIAVTSETIGKALGPVASSSIFAWTLRTWGWHGHSVVFFILAGLSMIQILGVFSLPSWVESERPRPLEEEKEATTEVP